MTEKQLQKLTTMFNVCVLKNTTQSTSFNHEEKSKRVVRFGKGKFLVFTLNG